MKEDVGGDITIPPRVITSSTNEITFIPYNATIVNATIELDYDYYFEWIELPNEYKVIAGNGDVNGDGLSDIVAFNNSKEYQELAIFFGTTDGYSNVPDIRTPIDHLPVERLAELPGSEEYSDFNFHIDGDVNGDGYSDLIFSFYDRYIGDYKFAGEIYIHLGSPSGFNGTPDLAINATSIVGGSRADWFGFGHYIDYAGDIDNDGFDDIVVNHETWRWEKSGITVVYGARDIDSISWELFHPDREFRTCKAHFVAGVGDLDKDGYDDVALKLAMYLLVYHGGPTGFHSENVTIIGNVTNSASPMAVDFDGDGWLDLFTVVAHTSSGPNNYDIAIARGPFRRDRRDQPDYKYLFESGRLFGIGRTIVDLDDDGRDDFLISIAREVGPDSPDMKNHDLGIFMGIQNMFPTKPTMIMNYSSNPDQTWVRKIGPAGDPDGDGRPTVWLRGIGTKYFYSSIYLLRQRFPADPNITVNGRSVFNMDGDLNSTQLIDFTEELQSILKEGTPGENGTVRLEISIDFDGPAKLVLRNFKIWYVCVEPPFIRSAVSAPDGDAINITWMANNDDATEYVLLTNASGEWRNLTKMPAKSGTYVHHGLINGRTYYYRFKATNPPLGIESRLGDVFSAVPRDTLPPPVPTGLNVTPIPEGNALRIAWDKVGGDCEGYRVFVDEEGEWQPVEDLVSGTNLCLHTGLIDGQGYRYAVAARDEVPNWSPLSAPVEGVPQDSVPPPIPRGVRLDLVPEGNAVTLDWNPAGEDTQGYNIYFLEEGIWVPRRTAPRPPYMVDNLTNGQEYIIAITAFDEVPNESYLSEQVRGIPMDTVPPQVPGNFIAIPGLREGEISLSWDKNQDDTKVYILERRHGSGVWTMISSNESTSCTDVQLELGETYDYRLHAIDDDSLLSVVIMLEDIEPRDLTPPDPPVLGQIPPLLAVNHLDITGTAEPLSTTLIYIDSELIEMVSTQSNGVFTTDITSLSNGNHYIEVAAKDKWNNTSPLSSPQWFIVDTIPPMLISIEPDLTKPIEKGTKIVLTFSEEIDTIYVHIIRTNGEEYCGLEAFNVENDTKFEVILDDVPDEEELIFRCSFFDKAGNNQCVNQTVRLPSLQKDNEIDIFPIGIVLTIIILFIIIISIVTLIRRN